MTGDKFRFLCSASVSILTSICLLISSWLDLPLKYRLTLYGLYWACNFPTAFVTLLFALTEWVKCRYLYIIASIKHRLYKPDTSISSLLLLPPEIRLQIWEELVPRARCARGDTRVNVSVHGVKPGDRNFTIEDALRKVLGFTPRKQTRLYPRMPVAFLRTCRQIYDESSHFHYSTSTFYFEDPRALHGFVNARSLSQKDTIRHLELRVDDDWYIRPERLRIGYANAKCLRDFAFRAFQVPSITKELRDLRTLDINALPPLNAEDSEYYAHSIYQLLKDVRVSKTLTVRLYFCDHKGFRRPESPMQWEWRSHCREHFATVARTLILDPKSRIPLAARTEQVVQTEYVLLGQSIQDDRFQAINPRSR